MILKQFMVRDCCEMFSRRYRNVLVAVLFILPLLSSASKTRRRRRPNLEELPENGKLAFPDQLAEATNQEPNNLISTSYAALKDHGNDRHGKIVVNVAKPTNHEYTDTLADAETAEEYVHKALKIQLGIQAPIPERSQSSEITQPSPVKMKPNLVAYEVHEKQPAPIHSPYTVYKKDPATSSNYDVYEYDEKLFSPSSTEGLPKDHTAEMQEYSNQVYTKVPDYNGYLNFSPTDSSDNYYKPEQSTAKISENEQFDQFAPKQSDFSGELQQSAPKSTIYYKYLGQPNGAATRYQHHIPKHRYNDDDRATTDLHKEEIMKQIEESVNRYMKHLEADGKATRSTQENTNIPKYRDRPKIPQKFNHLPPFISESMPDVAKNIHENIQLIYKPKTRSPFLQKNPPNFNYNNGAPNLQQFDLLPINVPPSLARHNMENYHDTTRDLIHNRAPLNSKSQRPELHRENQILDKNIQDTRPIVNPFQVQVLQKQPSQSNWQPINPITTFTDTTFDSYNPKFNNNPEGFGYQHNYKPPEIRGNHATKRHVKPAKRMKYGENKLTIRNNFNVKKDTEASVALRPPPY